jgi:hypothetical protein
VPEVETSERREVLSLRAGASYYGGELTLDFTVFDSLKAEEQLLVEYRRDPA